MAWTLERFIADPRVDEKASIMLGSGGTPNGVQKAPIGTLALVRDAATVDLLWYVNTDGSTAWSVAFKPLASGLYYGSVTPAALSATNVHAGVAGTAPNAFPGPFTNPDVPRSARLVFGAGWDGGDVLLTGTSGLGVAQTETVANPGAGGGTVETGKVWATITAATKAAIGINPATCSIGRGQKLAVTKAIVAVGGIVTCDDVDDAATWDRTNSAFIPTQIPNGSHVYRWAVIG